MDPQDDDAPPADLVRRGLVVQTLQSLCVRLCCIEAAIVRAARTQHAATNGAVQLSLLLLPSCSLTPAICVRGFLLCASIRTSRLICLSRC